MSKSLGSNCYILLDEKAVVIDPGLDSRQVLEKICELHIAHYTLINTHCHYDHIKADYELMKNGGVRVAIHELDADALGCADAKTLSPLFGEKMERIRVDMRLREGQEIELGEHELEVIHTPGHTPGSICLYDKKTKSLFSGDTIFKDGIGRTDLPGGNQADLKKSVKKLIRLNKEHGVSKLYPGHGPAGNGQDLEKVYRGYFEE